MALIPAVKRQERALRSQLQLQQGEGSEESESDEEEEKGAGWGGRKAAYYEQGEVSFTFLQVLPSLGAQIRLSKVFHADLVQPVCGHPAK